MGASAQRTFALDWSSRPITPETRNNIPKAKAENILAYRLDRCFDSRELLAVITFEGYRFLAPAAAFLAAQYFRILSPTAFR
jgi:hypothetical protein